MLLRAGIAAMLLALAACGGGGEEAPPPGLQPTLASVQANIFTPTCAVVGCHTGANAMLGLNLDAGESAASLINIPSFYGMMLVRLVPGDPDNSFLIQKLEGTTMLGGRMPLNGPYLQQVTIQVIKEWIQSCSANACP
jgi:hypothetical protein